MSSNTSENKIPMTKTSRTSDVSESSAISSTVRKASTVGRMSASTKTSPQNNILSSSKNRRVISSSDSEEEESPRIVKRTEMKSPAKIVRRPPTRINRSPSTSPEPVKTVKSSATRAVRSPSNSPKPSRGRRSSSSSSEKKVAPRSRRDLSSSPEPDSVRMVVPSTKKAVPTFANIASGRVKTTNLEMPVEEPLAELPEMNEQGELASSVVLEDAVLANEGEVIERKTSPVGVKKIPTNLVNLVNKTPAPGPTKPKYEAKNDGSVTYVLVRITCRENLAFIKSWIDSIVEGDEDFKEMLGGLYPIRALRVVHNRVPENMRNASNNNSCYRDNYDQYRESIVSLAAIHPDVWDVIKLSDYAKPNAFMDHQLYMEEHKIRDTERPVREPERPGQFACVPELFCCFRDRKYITAEESMEQMYLKMQNMEECGFVKHNEYTIRNPRTSRDFDAEPKLFCVITFADTVPEIYRIYIKTCLDQTKFRGQIDPSTITEDDPVGKHIPYMCVISWARLEMMEAIDDKYRSRKTSSNYQTVSKEAISKTLKGAGKGRTKY